MSGMNGHQKNESTNAHATHYSNGPVGLRRNKRKHLLIVSRLMYEINLMVLRLILEVESVETKVLRILTVEVLMMLKSACDPSSQ